MPSITGSRNLWSTDRVTRARQIKERGWCRKFTDFLFQTRIGRTTSHQWRNKYPEWKALTEGFPTKTNTFETQCLTQQALWRFEELLAEALGSGAAEREANWSAADQTLAEFRAKRTERSRAARVAKNGPDKPRMGKGKRHKPAIARRKAMTMFHDISRWAAISTLCHLHGMTAAEVLQEFYCNEHAMDYYMTARRELERTLARIEAGSRHEHLVQRYWPDWIGAELAEGERKSLAGEVTLPCAASAG